MVSIPMIGLERPPNAGVGGMFGLNPFGISRPEEGAGMLGVGFGLPAGVGGFANAASNIGSNLTSSLDGTIGNLINVANSAGNGGGSLGSALGAGIGSVIPGVGTVVGGLVGSIFGDLFDGVFGGASFDEKKAEEVTKHQIKHMLKLSGFDKANPAKNLKGFEKALNLAVRYLDSGRAYRTIAAQKKGLHPDTEKGEWLAATMFHDAVKKLQAYAESLTEQGVHVVRERFEEETPYYHDNKGVPPNTPNWKHPVEVNKYTFTIPRGSKGLSTGVGVPQDGRTPSSKKSSWAWVLFPLVAVVGLVGYVIKKIR